MGLLLPILAFSLRLAANTAPPFPQDPQQRLERTCFQTSQGYTNLADLRSDVAIVYGIGSGLPDRIRTWRDRGYRIHVMTGVAWGQYQDYFKGRFDGVNHEDEEQTDRNGTPHGHGGGMFYICPSTNYGKFLCADVQRALDAGTEAIHLEEPEFWVQDGYEEGFKREWRSYYGEDWQPPHSSVDAQWRASKLKYFLYRRVLQQVFDYVQDFNRRTARHIRCYVPTHSLLNYAHWRIVSPESSLAQLNGCDGYIGQVWSGTARTPNLYRGQLGERTFETAFLEYGAVQNLARPTGRTVWFLNDPIEDNPNYDWADYQTNWESTVVASLLQPQVWRFEVAPWPERVFAGRYPRRGPDRRPIPPAYATELQTVMNTLNDMRQPHVEWDCGTTGIGVLVSDSLMFQRGEPAASDPHLSNFYGLALPLLKRGMPIMPVQLEHVATPHYLDDFRILLLTYHGMKPLSPEMHGPLAGWVKRGGVLVVCDNDSDPYNGVREWWNSAGRSYATPREHLFEELGLKTKTGLSEQSLVGQPTRPSQPEANGHGSGTNLGPGAGTTSPGQPDDLSTSSGSRTSGLDDRADARPAAWLPVGKGGVIWMREDPARLATTTEGDTRLIETVMQAATHAGMKWRETNYLLLRRGAYVIAAGLDESPVGGSKELSGRFVNLFDSDLRVQDAITLASGSRFFLLDLAASSGGRPRLLASACKALPARSGVGSFSLTVEGVANTAAVVLLHLPKAPRSVALAGQPLESFEYSQRDRLLWIRFNNEARPRELQVRF